MKQRLKFLFAVILIAVAAASAWHLLHPEPSYGGKPVSYWLQQKEMVTLDWQEVTKAFHEIGPRAVPYIVSSLTSGHSRAAQRYLRVWTKSPGFVRGVLPAPRKPISDVTAVNAFVDIGPAVIPILTGLLKDNDEAVRYCAAWALESLKWRGHGETVEIAQLISGLADPSSRVRVAAASALARFGPEASAALVPLTTRVKKDADPFVRAAAAQCLGKIGPAAKGAVPNLNDLLSDAEPYARMSAAIAIWRIDGNTNMLPRMLDELPKVIWPVKWQIFEAMGEMGPAAYGSSAVLIWELKDRNSETRQRAAEALWKIAPDKLPLIVEAVIEPMNDPRATTVNPFSVMEGARLLGEIGPPARDAIPALTRALEHSEPLARTAAATALKRIVPETVADEGISMKQIKSSLTSSPADGRVTNSGFQPVVPATKAQLSSDLQEPKR
jgi:HEAT repeat protein